MFLTVDRFDEVLNTLLPWSTLCAAHNYKLSHVLQIKQNADFGQF